MQLEELAESHEVPFLKMVADYQKHDPEVFGRFFSEDTEWTSAGFKKFVKDAAKQRLDWRPGAKKVSLTRYVLLAPDGSICANALMRFPLDKYTEIDGGNLVCDVPPSLRGRGAGSVCLSLMLFEAVRAGLRRVLCTCRADDQAARRVIEKNRGTLEDIVNSIQPARKSTKISRYWIRFS